MPPAKRTGGGHPPPPVARAHGDNGSNNKKGGVTSSGSLIALAVVGVFMALGFSVGRYQKEQGTDLIHAFTDTARRIITVSTGWLSQIPAFVAQVKQQRIRLSALITLIISVFALRIYSVLRTPSGCSFMVVGSL